MKPQILLSTALLATGAAAIGPASPSLGRRLKGKPEKLANWRWPNPFTSAKHSQFAPACTAERAFPAQEFILDDLSDHPPRGLLPYREALKEVFSSREYPGSWDGIDPHGYDRNLLLMAYTDVPLAVREWIEAQERGDGGPGKGLFAVFRRPKEGYDVLSPIRVPEEVPVSEEWRARDDGRVVVFAPGALHEVLPLWVAEGSECEESLRDLTKYSADLVDGGVVAYPVHHSTPQRARNKRDIEFRVKAEVLKKKEEGEDAAETATTTATAEKVEKTGESETAKSEAAAETKSAERDEL
ncbi:uncharacterized protein THITE_2110984 [Thermothielavioides terrestris NRRL 8126]|uniref:Uncharacterized protein n=1 Tax=Thermothielavioides terrestris (strain ATCC 38088 / NRRL 8126) TaxID=578455 RepID=G2QVV7_THETT|nr:uncharacterized protein THITE_2110984 [Thermothielavioides terrestris NRRL 8126]AEO64689.1 hypothetical protein THITE_2110984 [Thermothielavioides terrestris NRRL 8126]